MELFIDKYKPTSFDQIEFSKESDDRLISLSKISNVPHIILKGRRGSGKRTRALLFLKERFGPGVFSIKNHHIETAVPNKKDSVILQIMVSPYHFQFNPSVHGVYDRVLLQKFIEEIVRIKIISNIPYRVVVIEDADLLTQEAQQSLRRTLETRIKNCRFIFLVNQEGHLIDPIYSRCSVIGVASPTNTEIVSVLSGIAKSEGLTPPPALLESIAKSSERNITTAIHMLQKMVVEKGPSGLSTAVVEVGYNARVAEDIIKTLISGTDITIFMNDVRAKVNDLFVNGVTGAGILLMLFKCALSKIPKSEIETIYNICRYASDYDNTIRLGGKSTYHIEAFCLRLFKEIKMLMDKRNKQKKATTTSTSTTTAASSLIVKPKAAPTFISKNNCSS